MSKATNVDDTAGKAMDMVIRSIVVILLLVWCLAIFRPFLIPVLWGVIIAVAINPVFDKLVRLFGGRRKVAAIIFTIVALVAVVWPTVIVVESVVGTTRDLTARMESGDAKVSPPPEKVKTWPVVGNGIYDIWLQASNNLESVLKRLEPQIRIAVHKLIGLLSGIGVAVVQSILALIVMGLFLAIGETGSNAARALTRRLGGETAEATVGIAAGTIRSVTKGVLGVALVQGLLCGVGMFAVGVPAAGVWTLLAMMLAIVQLPPTLVMVPVIIYVFSTNDNTTVAVIFAIWSLLAGMSDNILKPMFLGRGVDIPMPVILIGAIGGMMLHGFIGLFVGAVVLSIAYSLLQAWLRQADKKGVEPDTVV